MKKIEEVYREIVFRAMEKKEFILTQSELSKKLNISLSIINLAVKKLNSIGALKIHQRGFHVLDIKKILPNVFYTAYSAYKLRFNDVPADYSEVYIYGDERDLGIIKHRLSDLKFSPEKSTIKPNFFVLKKDASLNLYKNIPIGQIFVDLWNLKEWYAKEFIDSMEEKLKI